MEELLVNDNVEEVVVPVEDETSKEQGTVRTIGSKEVGESPEEKEQRIAEIKEKLQEYAKVKARESVIIAFKTPLRQVIQELNKGKTLDDIIAEIKEKKSMMTKSARDFCLNFKPEVILELVEDIKNKNKERKEKQ